MPSMSLFYLIVFLQLWLTAGSDLVERNNKSGFVSVKDGRFQLDGKLVDLRSYI